MRNPCTDHQGNKFSTKKEMCEHWGIGVAPFSFRIKMGWNLKKALETPTRKGSSEHKVCYDHLGNKFETEAARAKHWGLGSSTVNPRLEHGWTLQKALETPPRNRGRTKIQKAMIDTVFFESTELAEVDIDGRVYRHLYKHDFTSNREFLHFLANSKVPKLSDGNEDFSKYIRLSYVSANFIAYYKVPWSNELKTSREVVEHYLPDLLPLYDKENPSGVYRPMLGSVNPEYRRLERELLAGKVTLENLLKQFNCTIEQFNARIKGGASVDEAITGKKDVLILDI